MVAGYFLTSSRCQRASWERAIDAVWRVVMLTGDNRRVAAAIVQQAGLDEFHAELAMASMMRLRLRQRLSALRWTRPAQMYCLNGLRLLAFRADGTSNRSKPRI
jgi:magnesium-transporting ATPase (P-type)